MALPTGSVLTLDIDRRVMSNACASFDGSTDYLIDAASDIDLDPTTDWTILWWHWQDSTSGTFRNFMRVSAQDDTPVLTLRNYSDLTLCEWQYDNDDTSTQGTNLAGAFVLDAWTHCCLRWDASAKKLHMTFDDGRAIKEAALTGTNTKWWTSLKFSLGATTTGTSHNKCRMALVTHVKGTRITDAQVSDHHNGGIGRGAEYIKDTWNTFGTKCLCYSLQEEAGNRTESTGNNGHALIDTNTVASAEGVTNALAAQFTAATSEYLSLTSNSEVQMGDIDFAIHARCYFDTLSANRMLVTKDNNTSGEREYVLAFVNGSGLQFDVFIATDTIKSVVSTVTTAVDTWYDVWAWHDATADKIFISVDDETPVETATTGALQAASAAQFEIGRREYSGSNDHMDGRIEDVALLKRTPTAAEITWTGGKATHDWIAAQARAIGDGANLLDDVVSFWPLREGSGTRHDIVSTNHLADNATVTTSASESTSRLLTDVSAAGINYAGVDTCKVYRWEDLSGNDHHTIQATVANQLFYNYNTGSPRIDGNGVDGALRSEFGVTYSSERSIVARGAIGAANDQLYAGFSSGVLLRRTSTFWRSSAGGNADYGSPDSNIHTFFNNMDTATDLHRVDGIQESTADNGVTALTGITILNEWNGSDGGDNSSIVRLAMIDGSLWSGTDIIFAEEWAQYGDAGSPALLPTGSVLTLDIEKRVMANSSRVFLAANSEKLTIADHVDFDITNADYMIAGWAKRTATQWTSVLCKGSTDNAGGSYEILLTSAATYAVTFAGRDTGDSAGTSATSAAAYVDDEWIFIVAWHDATGNVIGVRVNDADEATTAFSSSGFNDNALAFEFGVRSTGAFDMTGNLAGWAAWQGGLLSAANITALYNGGIGRGADWINDNLSTNLVANWGMQEEAGDAVDSSGNSHTLTDTFTVTSAEGVTNALAAQFTAATTEYLSLASTAAVQAGDIDFTIRARVYGDSYGANRMIVTKDDNTSGEREYTLSYINAVGFRFDVYIATDSIKSAISTVTAPSTATWYDIIAWHDATANKVYISVDDETAVETATTAALQAASAGEFRIGAREYTGSVEPFDGRIEEVGLWKSVLTSAERTWLQGKGATDLIAAQSRATGDGKDLLDNATSYWPLGEGSGTRHDIVSTNHLADNATVTTAASVITNRLLTDVSAAGINYAGSDSCKVWRHEDLSGDDHHALQDTFANQPEYSLDTGVPEIMGAGFSVVTWAATKTGAAHYFCYSKMANSNRFAFDDGAVTGRSLRSDGATDYESHGGVAATFGTPSAVYHTFATTYDTASDSHRLDGSELSTSNNGTSDSTAVTLLADYSGARNHTGSRYHRFAVYDAVKTGADVTDAEEWVQYGDVGAPKSNVPWRRRSFHHMIIR